MEKVKIKVKALMAYIVKNGFIGMLFLVTKNILSKAVSSVGYLQPFRFFVLASHFSSMLSYTSFNKAKHNRLLRKLDSQQVARLCWRR